MKTGRLLGTCALAAAMTAFAPPAEALRRLDDVAVRLDLTPAGAPGWLARLENGAGRNAPEQLLVVSDTGRVVMARLGSRSSITLDPELDRELLDPANAIVLVHNHPQSTSLSGEDLDQLAKPGVVAVVAVAHDGGIYMAARGPNYEAAQFSAAQYSRVRQDVLARLRMECSAGHMSGDLAWPYVSHLTNKALAQAEVIEYRAILGRTMSDAFRLREGIFDRVVYGSTLNRARRGSR